MGMPWFKLWSDMRGDAKIGSLTDSQFRVWINLMCLASEQQSRGMVEGKTREVLAVEIARGNLDLLNETLSRLESLQIVSVTCVTERDTSVTGVRICLLNWDKRQYSVTTLRQRKCRARKKLKAVSEDLSRSVTLCHACHTEEDKEEDKEFVGDDAPAHVREEHLSEAQFVSRSKLTSSSNGRHVQETIAGENNKPQGDLNSAPPSVPSPPPVRSRVTDATITVWARAFLGDRFDLDCIGQLVDGWLISYPASWIKSALQIAVVGGVKSGGLGSYANKILIRWEAKGEPDYEEINRARAKANGSGAGLDIYDTPDFKCSNLKPIAPIQDQATIEANRASFARKVRT